MIKDIVQKAAKVVERVVAPRPERSSADPADPFYSDRARRRAVNERSRRGTAWIPRRPGWLR